MGKKNKSKKKVSGTVKTALKTEKKLSAKKKKELAALGEDDIENVIREIEKEEARRQRVVEKVVDPPSRRVNFSLTVHPIKEEFILFGGEFCDGRATVVYGDLYFYNLNKKEWTIVKAPNAPPPRCGHQAVATPTNKGELWMFGGEFSSPSESQFYHYKDLWVYRIVDKKWEKILSPNGPSARSGHRMVHIKKQLIVFGGFHDNLREYKYFNDVYIFHLDSYTWNKLDVLGNPPLPRSGCIVLPTADNQLLVYGGYSKEKIKKDIDKGVIHTDMFLMSPDKHDQSGLKWKWTLVKQLGMKPSARCGASAVLVQSNLAYIFGGVFDIEDTDEELQGTFFNDLMALDLEKFQWHTVVISGKKDTNARRRRRKPKSNDDTSDNDDNEEGVKHDTSENDNDSGNGNDNDDEKGDDCTSNNNVGIHECQGSSAAQSTNDDDDGIFTVTVGPALASNRTEQQKRTAAVFVPSPRINAGLAVKHNIMYLYGGMFEDGDRLFTLNDLYSLDTRKLDEWKIIISDDSSSMTWYESSSGSSEDGDSDESDSSESDSDNEYADKNES